METLNSHKVKWQVSLSNGETFFEGKGDFIEVAGELSPWQKLLAYLRDNKLNITSISLYTDDNKTFNLPSLGKNPKFSAFFQDFKPIGYNMERQFAKDHGESPDLFTTISAIYRIPIMGTSGIHLKMSLWVDENNTNNCWSLLTLMEVK